jgi:DEAD/DEAH box helicase domain-containing protein
MSIYYALPRDEEIPPLFLLEVEKGKGFIQLEDLFSALASHFPSLVVSYHEAKRERQRLLSLPKPKFWNILGRIQRSSVIRYWASEVGRWEGKVVYCRDSLFRQGYLHEPLPELWEVTDRGKTWLRNDGYLENIVFFDLETKRGIGKHLKKNIAKLGLALAATWDHKYGFRVWLELDARSLIDELAKFDLIVGFNLLRFDYWVLSGYYSGVGTLLRRKTLDMMAELRRDLGYRVSLDNVARSTLRRTKMGPGAHAPTLFREGRLEELATYCKQDVALTRDLYWYGRREGEIYYWHRWRRRWHYYSVQVDWGNVLLAEI